MPTLLIIFFVALGFLLGIPFGALVSYSIQKSIEDRFGDNELDRKWLIEHDNYEDQL